MKKLLALLAALLIAAPAFAADNLELSGDFYLKGWDVTNENGIKDNDSSFFEQRLRVESKFKANDNTYVVLRTDFAEGAWGDDFAYRHTNANNKELEVDRAYAVLDRDMFTLTVGLQHFDLGIAEVVDYSYTGAKLDLKFDGVTPTIFIAKENENGSLNDDDPNDDRNLYAVNVNFALAPFDSNLFFALVDDNGKATDASQWGLGFNIAGKLAMVDLVAELATFGGDNAAGTQAYLKASADVNEMISIGGELFYALGDKDQIASLSDDSSFNPFDSNTPIDGDVVAIDSVFMMGKGGVMGLTLFGEVRPMEALAFGAKLGYFTPEDDDLTLADSMTTFNAWVGYDVGPNTNVSLTYVFVSGELDAGYKDPEDWGTLQGKFVVKF